MNKTIYSKSAKKYLDLCDKKTAKRIVEGILEIPLGDIKRLEGKNVPLYIDYELVNIGLYILI